MCKNKNPNNKKKNISDVYISFQKDHVDKMFELLKSDENVKFIGVFMHLSYWSVFGGVNPVQVDLSTKKKMFLMIS